MQKWADYLISAVRYNSAHTHIDKVKVHDDLGDNVGSESIITRQTVISQIDTGKAFMTIVKGSEGKWNKGKEVFVIKINGTKYIKTVSNNIEQDNLENLPEF